MLQTNNFTKFLHKLPRYVSEGDALLKYFDTLESMALGFCQMCGHSERYYINKEGDFELGN